MFILKRICQQKVANQKVANQKVANQKVANQNCNNQELIFGNNAQSCLFPVFHKFSPWVIPGSKTPILGVI